MFINIFLAGIIYFLDTPVVVGIAFAAFVIGALLTGALWFIYSHTGEKILQIHITALTFIPIPCITLISTESYALCHF